MQVIVACTIINNDMLIGKEKKSREKYNSNNEAEFYSIKYCPRKIQKQTEKWRNVRRHSSTGARSANPEIGVRAFR